MQARMEQNHWSTVRPIHRIASFFMGVAVVLWLVSAIPAHAASVSYFLDESNRLPDGTNYLKVTIDDEGRAGAINFHIQALPALSGLVCDEFGVLKFGFNGIELDKNNILGLPDGWKIKHDKKMDGFGKFENVLIGKKWNGQDPLSFSISGIDGDSIYSYANSHDGGNGDFFSTFVSGTEKHRGHDKWHGERYFKTHDKSDSEWYGEWYTNNCHRCTKSGYFGGGSDLAPVPVPGALWLFGSGLIGLLGLGRRSRNETVHTYLHN